MNNLRLGLLIISGLLIIGLVLFFSKGKDSGHSNKKNVSTGTSEPTEKNLNKPVAEESSNPAHLSKSELDKMRAKLIDLREKAGIDPHHAMRWIDIAKVYNNMGEYYKACQYLKKAMEMEPEFKAGAAVEDIIEQCNRKFPGLSSP